MPFWAEAAFPSETLFKPYLCFAAVPGKKEEKTTKTVEQGKKKMKEVDIIFFRKTTTWGGKHWIQTGGRQ